MLHAAVCLSERFWEMRRTWDRQGASSSLFIRVPPYVSLFHNIGDIHFSGRSFTSRTHEGDDDANVASIERARIFAG